MEHDDDKERDKNLKMYISVYAFNVPRKVIVYAFIKSGYFNVINEYSMFLIYIEYNNKQFKM